MKKLLLALLLFGSFPAYIYCQTNTSSGYIITNSNDTLPGEVKFKKRLSAVSFSSGSKGSKQLYSPHQIKGFGYYGGKFYQPVSVPVEQGGEELVFANTLVSGKASLLKHESSYILLINDTSYHISVRSNTGGKDDHSAQKLNNRQLGIVNALLLSCSRTNPAPIEKISNEVLSNSVIAYNECLGEPYIEHNNALPWSKAEFGLAVGTSVSKINFSNHDVENAFLSDVDFSSTVTPTIGLTLIASSPRINKNLFFQADIFFDRTTLQAKHQKIVKNYVLAYHDIYAKTISIQVPITLGRTIYRSGLTNAYIRGGIVAGGFISKDLHWIEEKRSHNAPAYYTSRESHPEYFSEYLGYIGAMGVATKISKQLKGYLELSYDEADVLHLSRKVPVKLDKSQFRIVFGILY